METQELLIQGALVEALLPKLAFFGTRSSLTRGFGPELSLFLSSSCIHTSVEDRHGAISEWG